MSEIHKTYICYNGDLFSYYIALIAYSLPLFAWHGIKALGYYDRQLSILILNLTWLPQILLNVLLQQIFEEERKCMPIDDFGGVIYGNPSLETQLFFSFAFFVIVFNYIRNKQMQLSYLLGLLGLCIFIIFSLWWSGNFYFQHLLNGAIVGTVVGSSIAVAIEIYFLDDFEVILNTRLMKYIQCYDTLCIRDDIETKTRGIQQNVRNTFFFIEDLYKK